MRKFLIFVLVVLILVSCCSCESIVDEQGIERRLLYGYFPIISGDSDYSRYSRYLVYDPSTYIVYYMGIGNAGYMSPYLIYSDGKLCGAIFENGEIKPIPYIKIDR